MADNANNIPETWLSLLGGRDVSGWLAAFEESPKKAVADLIWDDFYFGPLNLTERGQLLAGWLDRLGNTEQFAGRLDAELTGWVKENWGRFDRRAEFLVSAWSCLCSVVEYSAVLPEDSRMKSCATALRAQFDKRQRFLGSFSTAPAADPLGLYLAVVAEFQGTDRSLTAFWHRMCDLPDGVPFYHARYAMLGLRRVKAADPSENGTLRAEVVLGLLRLARAFDRLVRERGLLEQVAEATFRRAATQTAAAYPDSPRWRIHGLTEALELMERPQRWLLDAVPPLAEAVRRETRKKAQLLPHSSRSIEPNPHWVQRARDLAARVRSGDRRSLLEVRQLLDEQRRYAEATGETYFVVRSLCNFASRASHLGLRIAQRWAEEAWWWEPHNTFTWTTIKDALLRQGDVSLALRFAWVAWKRFPEDVVARNGLADVLKAAHRYDEAEVIYRQTIERFPENVFARTGLADTLRRSGHFKDAEAEYRRSIKSGYVGIATLVGLAYLVLRKGEPSHAEVLGLVDRALKLSPLNHYARSLREKLQPASEVDLRDLAEEWDQIADAFFEAPAARAQFTAGGEDVVQADEHEASPLVETDQRQPPVQKTATPEAEHVSHSASEIEPQLPFAPSDAVAIAAIVAEAYFHRMWAKSANTKTAGACRQKAAELLAYAEQLSPQDPQVLAERVALSVDGGDEAIAYESLTAKLGNHPAEALLLVLKARLDREKARKENRPLSDSTLTDLCVIPQRLRDLNPALTPLFHFQKGLAALALLDGAARVETAADAFFRFRRILAYRATEERNEREQSHDGAAPRFHEWLQTQVNNRVFVGSREPDKLELPSIDIPLLDATWEQRRTAIEEVEDVFADHVAFGTT